MDTASKAASIYHTNIRTRVKPEWGIFLIRDVFMSFKNLTRSHALRGTVSRTLRVQYRRAARRAVQSMGTGT
jgi:hypothetical protein